VAAQSGHENRYTTATLAANADSHGAPLVLDDMVNAWGLAIRPQGGCGHFWVGAGGASFEFVGDVAASPVPALRTLHQDELRNVTVPCADSDTSDAGGGKITGVVFNPALLTSDSFVVSGQPVEVDGHQQMLSGSSRFLLATDSGRLSAWTEQGADGGIVRHDGPAPEMFNGEPQGMNFFGLALAPGRDDTLWAAFRPPARCELNGLDHDTRPRTEHRVCTGYRSEPERGRHVDGVASLHLDVRYPVDGATG
jgi:hypothetical protein